MSAIATRISGNYTGEVLGDRIVFDDSIRTQQTPFVHSGVDNYVVCSVLPQWDETLSRTVVDPLFEGVKTLARTAIGQVDRVLRFSGEVLVDRNAVLLTSSPIEAEIASAYDAVRYAEKTLGVPVTDIVKSCGISRRTFYSWQKPGARQPRLSSEGRLWLLVQMVEDLQSILGDNVSRWVREDPKRRALLIAGEYDALFSSLMSERSRINELSFPAATGPASLVDGDVDVPRAAKRRIPSRSTKIRRRTTNGLLSDVDQVTSENS